MRPSPAEHIDSQAIVLWRIQGVLRTLMHAAVATPALLFLGAGLGRPLILAAILPLIVIEGLLLVLVVPPLRWRQWRYQLDPHELDLQHGLWVLRRTLVPLVRVQHVDTSQGPVGRWLGITAVTVHTAAGVHEIPGLSDAVAEQLRDHISVLAREAREQI